MGSVKQTTIIQPANESKPGVGVFRFSDDYSIFDWGIMPDEIERKGLALAAMAGFNFERLKERGIRTHYQRFFGLDRIEFDLAVKYSPIARNFLTGSGKPNVVYDYSFFKENRGQLNNFLIPLEIIFRNGLPKGSSVFKKLKKAEGNPASIKLILDELGLTKVPKEGDMLPKPIIGYTTKLEEGDRNLTEDEAYRISGLTEKEFVKIAPLALQVNDYINERAKQTGLAPHWDGKVEMVYNNGLVLADVLGTLDEDRFGDGISKEVLRQWYKIHQPKFAEACDKLKETGEGWQERCVQPIKLPRELSRLVSQMYMSACNLWVGEGIFSGVPNLENIMENLKEYRD